MIITMIVIKIMAMIMMMEVCELTSCLRVSYRNFVSGIFYNYLEARFCCWRKKG